MATVNANTIRQKKCACCKKLYLIHEMCSDSGSKDGLSCYCLTCTKLKRKKERRAKGVMPNTLKKDQLYLDTAKDMGLLWCSGFNPDKRGSNGHLAPANKFRLNKGVPFHKCHKCETLYRRHYYATKKQAKQAVQE